MIRGLWDREMIALMLLAAALPVAVTWLMAAGPAAAAIEGTGVRGRFVSSSSYVIGGLAFVAATTWYAMGKSSIVAYELLVPAAMAAVPFLAVRRLVSQLL